MLVFLPNPPLFFSESSNSCCVYPQLDSAEELRWSVLILSFSGTSPITIFNVRKKNEILFFHVIINFNCKARGMCVSVCSVMSDSLGPRGLSPPRLLCPWNSPGKNTRVSCYFLLQGIFLTQGSNLHFLHHLHDRWILYHLCHLGSPTRGIFIHFLKIYFLIEG